MGVRLILQHQGQKMGVDLKDGAYVIGRDDRADIVIPDGTVSGRHAEIQVLDDSCMIRDLGSSNGTFVNGEKIRAAKEIRPSDSIQVGAIPIGIEIKKAAAAQPATPVAPTARLEAQKEAVKEAKSKLPIALQFFISGALAVLSLTAILMFVQIYSESAGSELRIAHRMKTLAAQYIHILKDNPDATSVPPPSFDTSLADPVMIANAKGDILYPAPIPKPDGTMPPSPIVNKETGRVFDPLKLGMQKMEMKDSKGQPIEVRTYPVRAGGDLVGYVLARPNLDAESSFGMILLMIGLASVVALVILYFSLSPVVKSMGEQIDLLRSKLSPLANGFIKTLPRSRNISELNNLAEEIEGVVTKKLAGAVAGPSGGAGASEFDAMVGDLVDTASLPYCFVDQDFLILTQNKATSGIGELAKAKTGTSIFESGMTNVQSRQLIEAVSEARKSGKGMAKVTLTWSGSAHTFDVAVRSFARGGSQDQVFGVLFNPSAS